MSKLRVRGYVVSEDAAMIPPLSKHMQQVLLPSKDGVCFLYPCICTGLVTYFDQQNMVGKVLCQFWALRQLAVSAFSLLSGSPGYPVLEKPLSRKHCKMRHHM